MLLEERHDSLESESTSFSRDLYVELASVDLGSRKFRYLRTVVESWDLLRCHVVMRTKKEGIYDDL
jgi:hypothetical protein